MTPKLQSTYKVPGSWHEVIASAVRIPMDMPVAIRRMWEKNTEIARANEATLTPQQFAEMFVDQNLAGSRAGSCSARPWIGRRGIRAPRVRHGCAGHPKRIFEAHAADQLMPDDDLPIAIRNDGAILRFATQGSPSMSLLCSFDPSRASVPRRPILAPPASGRKLILINGKSNEPAQRPQTDFNQWEINP